MRDGKKRVSSGVIFKHLFKIFEDPSSPPSSPFSFENEDNKKESLGNSLVWIGFDWVGATGFEPAT